MSKKAENLAVGSSPCPIKDCAEAVDVFKYRTAAGVDEKRRRFAGRLYCVCPKHGRVENQEFLLEHVKWTNEKSTAAATSSSSPPTPAPIPTSSSPPTRAPPPRAPPPKVTAPPAEQLSSWLMDYGK